MSVDDAAKITGLDPADIVKAAEWIAMPKEGGKRRRTMFGYEKGLIWGNDNYRTNGALVNIALATGNVGQMGGGVVRLGGHQEGYVRPDYPGSRPAPTSTSFSSTAKAASTTSGPAITTRPRSTPTNSNKTTRSGPTS